MTDSSLEARQLAHYTAILSEAQQAATEATIKHISENPNQWYPCGFAWVLIKPARGGFVNYLKKREIGNTSYSGGYSVWNPSGHPTQWMDAKFEGATAFAKVLQKYGIKAYADQRMD